MAEMGLFENQRVELIDGEIICMSPQNNPHALAVSIIDALLHRMLPAEFTVRCQLPLVANESMEPEPDFAVVAGGPESQREHPRTALLVIEVADTTLAYDRKKASLYASVQVPEYWIVDLAKRRVEVRRNPIADNSATFGFTHRELAILAEAHPLKPMQLPMESIPAAKLFPAIMDTEDTERKRF